MRAPGFWHRPPGFASALLSPLGAIYAAGTVKRVRTGARDRIGVPVICVGNLTAGGTGKTPTVIAVARRLMARGLKPHALTRGYGGSLNGPDLVDPVQHKADATGDEALLLAAFLPTWVAKSRVEGARAAVEGGAEVLILDDGFQDASLAYDLSIVVADAGLGFGNGRVIPGGPLREPVPVGLKRADVLLSIGPAKAQASFASTLPDLSGIAHVIGALAPLPTGLPLAGLPVLAFAGIGHPAKFFATLRDLGADIRAEHALADHQPLSDALMTRLAREASIIGAQLVTTEKDAVRLPDSFRSQVLTVPVRLEIDDWSAIDAAIDRFTNENGGA